MKSKKPLRELYERIKFLTGLTQQEIADRLNYERPYLSTIINSSEENETAKAKMELVFAKELSEPKSEELTQANEEQADYKKKKIVNDVGSIMLHNQIEGIASFRVILSILAEIQSPTQNRSVIELQNSYRKFWK